jgi:periplasmic protein TonB
VLTSRSVLNSLVLHITLGIAIWALSRSSAQRAEPIAPKSTTWVEVAQSVSQKAFRRSSQNQPLHTPSVAQEASHEGPAASEGQNSRENDKEPGSNQGDPLLAQADPKLAIINQIRGKIDRSLEYPESLRRRRIQGETIIRIVISEKGEITSSEITQSSGYAELDRLALSAALRAGPFTIVYENRIGKLDLSLPILFKLN